MDIPPTPLIDGETIWPGLGPQSRLLGSVSKIPLQQNDHITGAI